MSAVAERAVDKSSAVVGQRAGSDWMMMLAALLVGLLFGCGFGREFDAIDAC